MTIFLHLPSVFPGFEALSLVLLTWGNRDEVLFYLPVTKNWLYQMIFGLVFICHSSYRGVVELFRDLFDMPISVGTIHNRLQSTAEQAAEINQAQDLSDIEVGLHDEIFQSDEPVLVGVDAASTYCLSNVNYMCASVTAIK